MIEQLTNEVYEKLNKEYQEYLDEISKKSTKEIIENAYPIAIKQELVDMFYAASNYDKYELRGLLKQENTLEFLYDAWLDTDGGIYELLEYCLADAIIEVGEEFISSIEDNLNDYPDQALINDMVSVLNEADKYNLCSSLKMKYGIVNSVEAIDVYEIFDSGDGKRYLYNTFSNLKDNEQMQNHTDIEEKILPKLNKLIILDSRVYSRIAKKGQEKDEVR